MYSKLSNLILGFHGCSNETFRKVLHEQSPLKPSENSYDWLGHGIYFWENNYNRALEWAESRHGNNFRVIGAVIDLGYCLNLSDSKSSKILENGYKVLESRLGPNNLPQNHLKKENVTLLRDLDCAVIQQIHQYNIEKNKKQFDSVRGLFIEGKPIYCGSGFFDKTHIQICIRNPNCIKGYFAPLTANEGCLIP
jgi:hypothetical protein